MDDWNARADSEVRAKLAGKSMFGRKKKAGRTRCGGLPFYWNRKTRKAMCGKSRCDAGGSRRRAESPRARAKGSTCLSPARRYENFRNFALGKEYRISSEGEVDDSELERQILEGGDGTIDPTIGTTFSEFGKLNQMKPEQQRVTGLAVGAPPVPRACPCSPLHTTHASAVPRVGAGDSYS